MGINQIVNFDGDVRAGNNCDNKTHDGTGNMILELEPQEKARSLEWWSTS